MSESGSLESLQALYAGLSAVSEKRFTNLDRLGAELDEHCQYFRTLLDKKARNSQSRNNLTTGKLTASNVEYEVNNEFQQGALQLADDLDLDEIESAKIFLVAQHQSDASERSVLTEAVIRFHQRRKYILDCLRVILQISTDSDLDEEIQVHFRRLLLDQIIQPSSTNPGYVSKCLSAMAEIKAWIQRLADKANGASVVGQAKQPELSERLEYERVSLIKQHETLGTILLYLVKENHSKLADFDSVLTTLSKADRYDNLLVHYFPAASAFISRFGGIEGGGTVADARTLNGKIMGQTDQNTWALTYVHAAVRVWWLAEYSSWFGENHDGSIPENQLDSEMKQRSQHFAEALKDGAFDFILSLSADVKPAEWHDPARHGLRQWLQRKAPVLFADSVSFADLFQELLMEQLETFIESFITNLPDVLRRLRVEEDQQRQLSKEHDNELDLERFIVIISYAFENRPKAAQEGFWDSHDSALNGFMHWASRRASTPLVSAFCEMLQALSGGEDNATSAHEFLLDEGMPTSGKMRRTHSLTWSQIFKELTFFSAKIRDRPAISQSQAYRPGKPHSDLAEAEPESFLMLECYLRLIARLCTESGITRQFLAHHPSFHIVDLLFQLASSSIEPRLRACAFTTLRSLLSHKSKEPGEYLWNTLEYWVSGGYSPGSSMAKAAPVSSSQSSMQAILGGLVTGFEEPNSFVQLLHALVLPCEDESGLRDGLPFPEQLGASTRMPGIDPYIDFTVGQIFAARSPELGDTTKVRLLQLTCLDFIITCLDTFNENLVIFAAESNVSIDAAIATSSLQEYVLLHPFSRVMEWMYDERVMAALFATMHHDPAEIASAAADSPLILCISRGIHVMTAILELQPTYLEIIVPLIKAQAAPRRSPVFSAKFSFFEEGILNHLSIIPDLGLLCGTGHPELVMASLKLLEKLSSSSKLTTAPNTVLGGGIGRNRVLAALDGNAETISRIMLQEIDSADDMTQGPESSTYAIKIQILDFVIACLKASPLRPSIAHRLLGFQCDRDSLSIDGKGSFNRGISLFHSILTLALESPLADDLSILSWLVNLNYKSQQVLKELWSSPLSSNLTLTEIRANNALSMMFIKEIPIQGHLLWDGVEVSEPTFLLQPSALCFGEYLSRRILMLQYTSAELRQISQSHAPSLKQRTLETILGSTAVEGGQKVDHVNLFDLFDFMDPQFNMLEKPQTGFFGDLEFDVCIDCFSQPPQAYDLEKVEELLILRRAEFVNTGRIQTAHDLQTINAEAQQWIEFFAIDNRIKLLQHSRNGLLSAWVQLALVVIGNGEFDDLSRTTFVLRSLQTIMPMLESDLENVSTVTELARLSKTLIVGLDLTSESFKQGGLGELVSDRLFHLFQVSLRAISLLGAQSSLKEIFYNISYYYLINMSDVTGVTGIHKRHSIQTIKSAGERFIDVVCDDAYAGVPTCRVAALLLLGSLVKQAKNESSQYITESLVRLNFIGILVESIGSISDELRGTRAEEINIQLSYCHSRLALLLQISQTRSGASAVLNAGLFHLIKQSCLFNTDPDLGVDIEGPDAVTKHYDLLSAVVRVICAALLSRGAHNEQSLEQGRRFLSDNRLSILAVLKKSAGLGAESKAAGESILELAECFMVLINVTGYLDLEEEATKKRQPLRAFT